jgi:hypothetical protein
MKWFGKKDKRVGELYKRIRKILKNNSMSYGIYGIHEDYNFGKYGIVYNLGSEKFYIRCNSYPRMINMSELNISELNILIRRYKI